MQFMRKKDGFTLMELLIVILTGSIVTMAATTVLLLAFRINRKSLDTVKRQSVARIMLSVLENMTSDSEYVFRDEDGELTPITPPSETTSKPWSIKVIEADGSAGDSLISYVHPTGETYGKIVTGNGEVLVEDIMSSMLYKNRTPFSYVKDLYTFSVKIEEQTYNSTVYSRTQEDNWYANDPLIDYENARKVLMEVVSYELGSSGLLRDAPNTTYAKWYSNNYGHWDATQLAQVETNAWCGCFVSWALNEVNLVHDSVSDHRDVTYISPVPQEANVNFLWLETYAQSGAESLHVYGDGYVPMPGDLIFFTDVREHAVEEGLLPLKKPWDYMVLGEDETYYSVLETELSRDKAGLFIHEGHVVGVPTSETCFSITGEIDGYEQYSVLKHFLGVKGDGLDHVGIVVKVKDGYVYTVEGNVRIGTEASKVVMRKYPLVNPTDEQIGNIILTSEPLRIFGYATLNWAGNP